MTRPVSEMTAEELATASAEAMWRSDLASQSLGIAIEAVGPGTARLSMTVRPDMTNGHGLCHGGFIFTLADSAFAFACNSYNQRAVAQHCSIQFLQPAHAGDRLTAAAVERQRAGRSGIYDITVTRGDGGAVAEFRGLSRTIKGTNLPPAEAE